MATSAAGCGGFRGALGFAAIRKRAGAFAQCGLHPAQISLEYPVLAAAILEAFHVCRQLLGGFRGKGVNNPCAFTVGIDHAVLTEIGEVLGYLYLRGGEDFLEMADAERLICKEVEDAQAGFIAEAFVDFDQGHGAYIP
jgi:hypothetical protein